GTMSRRASAEVTRTPLDSSFGSLDWVRVGPVGLFSSPARPWWARNRLLVPFLPIASPSVELAGVGSAPRPITGKRASAPLTGRVVGLAGQSSCPTRLPRAAGQAGAGARAADGRPPGGIRPAAMPGAGATPGERGQRLSPRCRRY